MKLDELKKQRRYRTKIIDKELKKDDDDDDDDDDERVAVIDTGMFSVKVRVCTVTVYY